MLCYLADIFSMCRLASWQAETTGALGMLSVQEISFILINATPIPPPAIRVESQHIFSVRLSFSAFLLSSFHFSLSEDKNSSELCKTSWISF